MRQKELGASSEEKYELLDREGVPYDQIQSEGYPLLTRQSKGSPSDQKLSNQMLCIGKGIYISDNFSFYKLMELGRNRLIFSSID